MSANKLFKLYTITKRLTAGARNFANGSECSNIIKDLLHTSLRKEHIAEMLAVLNLYNDNIELSGRFQLRIVKWSNGNVTVSITSSEMRYISFEAIFNDEISRVSLGETRSLFEESNSYEWFVNPNKFVVNARIVGLIEEACKLNEVEDATV